MSQKKDFLPEEKKRLDYLVEQLKKGSNDETISDEISCILQYHYFHDKECDEIIETWKTEGTKNAIKTFTSLEEFFKDRVIELNEEDKYYLELAYEEILNLTPESISEAHSIIKKYHLPEKELEEYVNEGLSKTLLNIQLNLMGENLGNKINKYLQIIPEVKQHVKKETININENYFNNLINIAINRRTKIYVLDNKDKIERYLENLKRVPYISIKEDREKLKEETMYFLEKIILDNRIHQDFESEHDFSKESILFIHSVKKKAIREISNLINEYEGVLTENRPLVELILEEKNNLISVIVNIKNYSG